MNHIVRILLAAGLSIAAVMIILLSTGHFGLQTHMDVFIAETIRSVMGHDVEIEQYVEANQPRRLQRDMIKAWVYRTTPYSRTQPTPLSQPISATELITTYPVEIFTCCERTQPTPLGQPISATELITTYPVEIFTCCERPLPYPPEDLWCIKLKSADPTIPKILLIAFHKDIYTASWVVHEPNDVDAVLSAVGCQFSTQ